MFGAAERALIGLQVARLRETGWPSGRAVALVAGAMPEGDARRELSRIADALGRGERPSPPSSDPLLGLLATGDAAGPGALREAAQAELEDVEAVQSAQAMLMPAAITTVGTLLLLSLLGWLAEAGLGWSDPPATTRMAITLLEGMRWVGPPAAALIVWAVLRGPARVLPGAAELHAAARLRRFASAVDAGLSEADASALATGAPGPLFAERGLALRIAERAFAETFGPRWGAAATARLLADHLVAGGRRRRRFWMTNLPLGVFAVLAVVAGPLILALFLPIFSIARSVQ